MRPKNIIQAILSFCIVGSIVFSASTSPPVMNDPYTGLYYVHGSKIVTYYTCPFFDTCGTDDGPFYDTTRIASVVVVKLMEDKTDTLHFFGLPGADEGEQKLYHGRIQLSDHVGGLSRYDDLIGYKIFGSFYDNSFEINHNNAGNRYIGTGTISNNQIEINGQKTFRTITVDYDLKGEKIKITQ